MTNGWEIPKPDKELILTTKFAELTIRIFGDQVNVGIKSGLNSLSVTLSKEQYEHLKLWMVLG